jgi:3-deoxy-7-phosphoheptulonate synthase
VSVDVLERSGGSLAWEQSDWVSWAQSDWRRLPIRQQPDWPDLEMLRRVTGWLMTGPGLVGAAEVRDVRRSLARVARGEGFVVQAGDCAETFERPTIGTVNAAAELLTGAAGVMAARLGVPVLPIGRIAGQYAKPRSAPVERVGGVELPVFRGFLVNSPDPVPQARVPDPVRLIRAYQHSSATLRLLRESPAGAAVRTSHEALVLDYEEAFVRWDPEAGEWFLASTHLPWVGVRTHGPGDAHVRFLSGVANPVGCKVGPDTTPDQLRRICERLDPERQAGRLVLIARMGAGNVVRCLPRLVAAVESAGHPVVWLCDPMHGNTVRAPSGHKVRHIETVKAELAGFFRILYAMGGWPGGIHLEAVGRRVTECVGGARGGVAEEDVPSNYESACDPRLNAAQTAEIVGYVCGLCRAAA